MPKHLQYRAGSLIYFQGDEADKIFLLKAGKVHLVYQDIETREDAHDLVQPGEFFGVKSALGRYPRDENALALQDNTAIMAFAVPEFETLVMSNSRIIMKMLKVFSNKMRRIHKQVSNLMQRDDQNPEDGLFSVGAYYLKNKRFAQAKYVFGRYLTYYPAGKWAGQAAKLLGLSDTSWVREENAKAAPPEKEPSPSAPPQNQGESGAPEPKAAELNSAARAYYDAVSMLSQAKYQQAYLLLKRIVGANGDAEYVIKSMYEIGRCFYLSKKYDDCIKYYTEMIIKYPKHPLLKDILFLMGQSYERNNRKEQAASFYKKILSIPGDEDDGPHVKAKRALKALEAQHGSGSVGL
ncbi:MAG: cyclic nucleotide-binding domain-containing protein [Treponema sp.]|jgi:CRP-like cAMP-binding protein|nr:cyclic nucleotide-binding domain-containing protein [Treponema sp.]